MENSRRMIYPYTLSAKIAQFPYKHHWNTAWPYKFYIIAVAVSFPFFWKMQKLTCSPENVKKFEESRRKDLHHHMENQEHLL